MLIQMFFPNEKLNIRITDNSLQLLVLLVVSTSAIKTTYPGKVSFGLYKEELGSPMYYDTFVPIIYEYKIPIWGNLDITLRDWRGKCETDDFTPSYSCPVFFHFEKFIERLQKDLVPQSTSNTNIRSVASGPGLVEDLCNSIQKHFPGMSTKQSGFDEYLQLIRKCPAGSEGIIVRTITDYIYNIKQIYKTMNQKFEIEFSNKFAANDRTGPAYYINALSSHQNAMLFNYWVEKTRWSQAQIACTSQFIPNSIVRSSNFSTSLAELELKLRSRNYISSIPMNETSAYFKVPIADCTFTESENFVVRILIPVRKRSNQPKMYRLKTVPFLYNDEKIKKLCQVNLIKSKYLYDEISDSLQETECESGSLCQIKDTTESSLPNMCISAFFSNSFPQVKKHCEFDCIALNEDFGPKLPIFRRVSSDTYVITGNSIVGILIKCDDRRDKLLEHQDFGALEIRLPCNCHLMFHSNSYHIQKPCSDKLQISQVTPVQFIKDSLVDELPLPEAEFTAPDANMLESELLPKSEKLRSQASNTESSSSSGNTVLWVLFILQTLIFMTLIVGTIYKYKLYRNDVTYSKERLVYNIQSISNPSIADTQRSSTHETTY